MAAFSKLKSFFSVQAETGNAATPAEIADRKKRVLLAGGGIILVIGAAIFAINMFFGEKKGPPHLGLCKTLLEQNLEYPPESKPVYIDGFGETLRVGYSTIDSFGQFRIISISCTFKDDPVYGIAIQSASINRIPLSKEQIDRFNAGLGALLAYPPDLTLPPPLPDKVEKLRRNL